MIKYLLLLTLIYTMNQSSLAQVTLKSIPFDSLNSVSKYIYLSDSEILPLSNKTIERTAKPNQLQIKPVHRAFFCKLEDNLTRKANAILSFRIGSLAECNRLEYSDWNPANY